MSLVTHLKRQFARAAGTDLVIDARVKGEANARFTSDANGKMQWGPGGATALDTTLERTGTSTLHLTGHFEITNTLTLGSLSGVLKATAGLISGSATTDDLPEGSNLYYTQARFDSALAAVKGAANGVATLDASTKIPTSQLPALAITDTSVVANEAAMLALTAETGDVAVRTDVNKTYILRGTDPTALADWEEMLTPTDTVISVNGYTGAVTLVTTDIAEGTNLYHTVARVRATVLTGLDTGTGGAIAGTDSILVAFGRAENRLALADTHRGLTDNPHTVTKAQVGLTNVTDDAQLKIASNLSDVASAATSRSNLSVLSKLETHNLTNPRVLGGGLNFDGITSATKVFSQLTNQNIGTDPFSLRFRCQVPFTTPSVTYGVMGLSSSSNDTYLANGLSVYINGSGEIIFRIFGGTTADYNSVYLPGFIGNYGGQTVDICLTRTGTTVALYLNGVAQGPATDSGGTPPTWAGSITSTYLVIGQQDSTYVFKGRIHSAQVYNLALSENEVLDIFANGIPFHYKWGSQVDLISNGGFETDTASPPSGWSHAGTHTATAIADTPPAGSNSMEVVASDTGNYGFNYVRQVISLPQGKAYRVSYYAKSISGGTIIRLGMQSIMDTSYDQVITGSWVNYAVNYTVTDALIAIQFQSSSGAATFRLDSVTCVRIGAFIDLDLEHADPSVTTTVRDRSSNALDGTASASGITQISPVKEFICDRAIVSTLTASQLVQTDANKRLVTSNALPTGATIAGFNLLRGRTIVINSANVSGGLLSGLTDPLTVTHGLNSTNLMYQLRYVSDRSPVGADLTPTAAGTADLNIGVTPGDGEFELVLGAF